MFAVTSDNCSFCAVEGFNVSVDEAAEAGRLLCRQSAPFFAFLKGSGVHFRVPSKFMPFRLSATVQPPFAQPNSKSIRRRGHARADGWGRVRIPSTFR